MNLSIGLALQVHYKNWYMSNGWATLRVGLEMTVYVFRVGESGVLFRWGERAIRELY